ncbi:aminodeoxychorismate lyase [Acidihalobacter yilgarnensis]|uniref:Aminodeoxychorismate lyase n=1 Tax=Acidihalobacter yilgarnensis TaxID=2819280 RepID=A0A1D8INP5_9GAMM|nr:aminodeoxychorismate lyase [Acidihalobacter yilgarnensis]AOU98098.1 aminodeoxychorismate lyase [Acidihalobacter yilgarnensis]
MQKTIPATDRGLAYGHGVFETMELRAGHLPHWPRHWQRLVEGCRRLGLPAPDRDRLETALLTDAPALGRHVLKLVLTAGDGGRGYRAPSKITPRWIVSLHPWPTYPATYAEQGVALRHCRTRLPIDSALAGIKHLNRLHQVLARAEWDDEAIAEGLLSDTDGWVVEGTMSNVFWIEGDTLRTPDLSRCGVAGIMRARILDWAAAQGIVTRIEVLAPARLQSAEGLFVCNSVIGLWPVRRLENHDMQIPSLMRELSQAVQEGAC